LVVLAVGRAQDFDQPLATLGTVKTIDITIPQPQPTAVAIPVATPESEARGRKVLQAAIRGLGGLQALEDIKNVSVLMEMVRITPAGEMRLTTKSLFQMPDKMRSDIASPMGAFAMVYDGTAGWVETPQGTQPLPASQVEDLKKVIARTLETFLVEALQQQRPVQFLREEEADGQKVDVIQLIDSFGEPVTLSVERATGHVVKKGFRVVSPHLGAVEQEQILSDFRPVGALTVPFKLVTFHGGQKVGDGTVKSYEINVGVDPALFERPAKPEEKQP